MKPGLKTIIAGTVVLLVGALVIPLLIVLPLVLEQSQPVQFKVPGSAVASVKDPGRYYLWNDFRTVFDGKSYDQPQTIPNGMQFQIRDAEGHPLPFISDTSISMTSGSSSRNTIGYVEVSSPGKIEIQVTGGGGGRVFSFSQSKLLKMFLLIMGGVGLSMLTGLIGLGLLIWGIVKLAKGNKPAQQNT